MPNRRSMGMPRKPTVQKPNTSNASPAPNLVSRPVRRWALNVRWRESMPSVMACHPAISFVRTRLETISPAITSATTASTQAPALP